MIIDDYYNYFNKFVSELNMCKAIHYVDIYDLPETFNKIKNQSEGFHLAVEDPTIATQGNSSDSIADRYMGAIVILAKLKSRTYTASQRNILLSDTFNLTQSIKILMIKDSVSGCHLLRDLQIPAFEMFKVGPLGDNLYGWRLQFEFKLPLNY